MKEFQSLYMIKLENYRYEVLNAVVRNVFVYLKYQWFWIFYLLFNQYEASNLDVHLRLVLKSQSW